MIEIFEYIVTNYTWFLGGTILILLAIIGYYADKTNFGQGQNSETNESKTKINLENVRLSDITNDEKNNVDNQINNFNNNDLLNQDMVVENKLQDNTFIQKNEVENIIFENNDSVIGENLIENKQEINNNVDLSTPITKLEHKTEVNFADNDINQIQVENEKHNENEINPLLTEDEIKKFNSVFDSLVPKKELINTDLLSDIDELNLGKTQKFDFNDVLDFDDIELPKIKKTAPEEQDIWKF